ncbi:class I SAM-dependent methyltransferase [Sabulilitoribacter multivorans]|uniref:Class I SAM-dependent methyltransferase n=1 Tax=Flaviramulus multivorans TaxID=1304750 RepID=A0ABS9IGT3_9FLAO|nr:class I SAM-dependent methyltransferase [Flaviramulus multivorans]MCF7559598.1 class I SAM-dependent methyltransferase [Flaviramulus multivorans]
MTHYNRDYFDYQKHVGTFGGKANLFKFKKYVKKDYKVIDFGSGGGYLLSNFDCKEKIGIEINPSAVKIAKGLGIKTVSDAKEIENNWADLIVSNHALEHVPCPLSEIKKLYEKLKIGGKIILVVPYEKKNRYKPNDINFHLYTWSEMNLGNLFTSAGFVIDDVKELKHRWPPKYFMIRKIMGEKLFNVICRIYGGISSTSQVKIIATKP